MKHLILNSWLGLALSLSPLGGLGQLPASFDGIETAAVSSLSTDTVALDIPTQFPLCSSDSLYAAHFDSLVVKWLPKGANVAIYAYDLTERKPLYAYQADKLGRPASNMKLLTTITAMDRAEGNDPFFTEVWMEGEMKQGVESGEVRGDTLVGNLYVVGGMDPEFDDAAMDSLVERVARRHFRVIRGTIYGDRSMRDSIPYGNGWCWDDIPYDYQPQLSPLMFAKGVVEVKANPGKRGKLARITLSPVSTYYNIENHTRSHTPDAGEFEVTRNWLQQGNRILVRGNVERQRSGAVTLHAPESYFMHTFVERLMAKGIQLIDPQTGKQLTVPTWQWAERTDNGKQRCIARYETAMQQVVDRVMKESDNLNTEALLTRLGVQATGHRHVHAEDGLEAVREQIRKVGLNPEEYNLADGCGLSNYNAISPQLLVAFLHYAYHRSDLFRKLYKALPVAGVDGTLKGRMKKGSPAYRNVHAKTGTISGISSLSGYLQGRNGHWIAFSIMNQNQLSGSEARRMQDKLCEEFILRGCGSGPVTSPSEP